MKRKLIVFLLVATTLTLLYSCKIKNKNNGTSNSENGDENIIYAEKADVSLISPVGVSIDGVYGVFEAIYDRAGIFCEIKDTRNITRT